VITGSEKPAEGPVVVLGHLADALGDASSTDDVARAALSWATRAPGVLRVGLAVSRGAGRELRFVASDGDAVGADGVRWCHIDGLADVPLAQAVRDGSPVFVRSLDDLANRYPQMLERQRALGTRSIAAIPLQVREARLGGLLVSFDTERDFGPADEEFLAAFATQVSQALRRGLTAEDAPSTAEQLQRSLMTHALPDLDRLVLGAHYHAGERGAGVGGDWYDVLPMADGSAVVALGDVMGKGSSAALLMGQVRAATRAYALLDTSPGVVLQRLDGLVRSLAVPEQIVTMVCGVVDPERRSLVLAVAGHPPPLLVPLVGAPAVLHGEVGPPLGLSAGPWPETVVDLDDDLAVLLYSNGLVESRTVDFFSGLDRVCDDVSAMDPLRRTPREVCARLGELSWKRESDDDVTLLAVGRTSRRRRHTAATDLPADATASSLARRFVRDRLREWTVDGEISDNAQLCVSELVTNAVIHTGTKSRLALRLDDERLLVSVSDRGGGEIEPRAYAEPLVNSGRGLFIVDTLAAAWSFERGVDGTTVWFELDVDEAAYDEAPPEDEPTGLSR
jgi:serine phosphatase RsbU (regulator of sigma subunit)/anti-sigma regulatory factor (Ser/Thr protein kinase)